MKEAQSRNPFYESPISFKEDNSWAKSWHKFLCSDPPPPRLAGGGSGGQTRGGPRLRPRVSLLHVLRLLLGLGQRLVSTLGSQTTSSLLCSLGSPGACPARPSWRPGRTRRPERTRRTATQTLSKPSSRAPNRIKFPIADTKSVSAPASGSRGKPQLTHSLD